MITHLFDYIKQDYELSCNLALAAFLELNIGKVINLNREIEEITEDIIQKIMSKTDLTRDEINEFLAHR